MKCRVCGEEIITKERVKKVNEEVCSVFATPLNTTKVDVDFYSCQKCGHHQIENIFTNEHYVDYNLLNVDSTKTSNGGSISYRMSYYEGVLERLRTLSEAPNKILDIGCGHGDILSKAKKEFVECVGVDPSISECEIARENNKTVGTRIITAFFDDKFPETEFDAVIATQVFEHLDAPENVMCNAFRVLKFGGVGYFDVPNGQRIFNNSEYYNIYAEHVNYFTQSSLIYLARSAGFDIIEIAEVMNSEHLAIFVRKPKHHLGFEEKRSLYMNELDNSLTGQDDISIWGCGIKGRNFIASLSEEFKRKIRFLFDSNPSLTGLYVNDCDVPISLPTKEKIEDSNTIIISATENKKEIMRMIRNEYQYRGRVVVLDELC